MNSPSRPFSALAAASAAAAALFGTAAVELGEAGSAADRLGWSALLSSSMFALLALSGALLTRRSLPEALGLGPGHLSWSDLALLSLGTLGISQLGDALLGRLDLLDGSILAELNAVIGGARGVTLAVLVLGIAIAPGVAEELLCRGLMQRSIQRRWGATAGVLLSSLVFGALHMDLAQGLLTFVLGLYLASMALATGSIRAGIAAHVLNNGAAIVGSAYGLEAASAQASFVTNGLAGAAALLGLRILLRELRPEGRSTS